MISNVLNVCLRLVTLVQVSVYPANVAPHVCILQRSQTLKYHKTSTCKYIKGNKNISEHFIIFLVCTYLVQINNNTDSDKCCGLTTE